MLLSIQEALNLIQLCNDPSTLINHHDSYTIIAPLDVCGLILRFYFYVNVDLPEMP